MAEDDRLHLLEHSSRIAKNGRDAGDSHWVEMNSLDGSDIGAQKRLSNLDDPPTYSSAWDRDVGDGTQKDSKSLDIRYLAQHYSRK